VVRRREVGIYGGSALPFAKRRLPVAIALTLGSFVAVSVGPSHAQSPASGKSPEASSPQPASGAPPAPAGTPSAPAQRFDIDQFRIDGADKLTQIDVEEAVYPFLGPNRTADDVEKARAALEKAYHDRGYQTVSVGVPSQNVANRVVVLKVTEGKVGRLRVTNAKYFDVDKIKKGAPSLKEGTLPNFNNVTKDIVALNQWPDRRVTPSLRAGVTPGTVDVDLNVEDKLPLHGSVEYNNRQSPNTTPTRVNATIHYDNFWQLGHSFSLSYQVAPERREDAEVWSGSYLGRLTDWTSVLVYGVDSKSDVATVGGMNVVGPGQIFGGRLVLTLPARDGFFHSLSLGADYKHFGQTVNNGADSFSSPITYYPLNATYGATWQQDKFLTQFNSSITVNLRGAGSDGEDWMNKRAFANSNFFHFNADLSETIDLPENFQFFGRVKGQLADGPLISSEQYSLGGLDTVRGYLESEELGDDGIAGTLEMRTPDIGTWLQSHMKDETGQGKARFTIFNEWRFFGFFDAGVTKIQQPLPEQEAQFNMWSYGGGTRFKLFNYVNGMVALAMPMISQSETQANDPHVLFSISGEF
jgi:hemolysin activation/secretion protein